MPDILWTVWPELALVVVGCVLFLFGISHKPAVRRLAAATALIALAVIFGFQCSGMEVPAWDPTGSFHVGVFAQFIKLIASGVSIIFVLMAWPTNASGTGSNSIDYATETGEFFGLMLLSIAGLFLVAGANDIILLFLGIVLASTPTYVMISIARPLPLAQEAGVKYFFLGALANAVALFGFSYLYGTTGSLYLASPDHGVTHGIADIIAANHWNLSTWQMLAAVLLIVAFSFKMAAVPLHFYVADVYQGAATPITAFLSWIPKTTGLLAIIKILAALGSDMFHLPYQLLHLMWAISVLTMTIGNVLATVQPHNVKRVLAYSSVAHSGYLLAGLTAALYAGSSGNFETETQAITGVIFYLIAYGVMNAGAFAVLQLLPARAQQFDTRGSVVGAPSAQSAETFDDIAGAAKRHPLLGLCMAICCFSLIGLPLTVGFFGKLLIIRPAINAHLYGLSIIIMVNAAISAAYYLRIIAVMYLRPEPETELAGPIARPIPVLAALAISATGTIVLGTVLPLTAQVTDKARNSSNLEMHDAPSLSAAVTEK